MRSEALALIKQGKSYGEVATALKITRSTVAGYVYRDKQHTKSTKVHNISNPLQLSYFT